MPVANWLPVATGLFSLIVSAVAVYLSLRKAPIDEKKTKADTTETYAKAADVTASRYIILLERLDKLEKIQDDLEDTLRSKENEIEVLNKKVTDLETEVARLRAKYEGIC